MAKVSEFMTKKVVTISPEASVLEASLLMSEKNIGSVVVAEGDIPVGIVTERDIIAGVVSKRLPPESTHVKDIMSKPLVTCTPECNIDEAASLMQAHKIKHLPVLKGRELVGIFTTYDLMVARSHEYDRIQATIAELMKEK
ncbi:MAG: CBS domain-containing protein [Candidatus Methanomethylicia archaeon]|jgi:CBS domain-containing protein|nr:CBS domain-containing protein [Candidatus Methanomethylicia archaeon]MCQ5374802.1 CBS domain-containing protein [Candidatus Methanomethylicia archaeon]